MVPGPENVGELSAACCRIVLRNQYQGGACGAAGPTSAPGSAVERPARRTPGRALAGQHDQQAYSPSPLMRCYTGSLFCSLLSGGASARRWPFDPDPLADVCARASFRLVKLGIMRSMHVIARTRRTVAEGMTSSSSPPSAWARLCTASRA